MRAALIPPGLTPLRNCRWWSSHEPSLVPSGATWLWMIGCLVGYLVYRRPLSSGGTDRQAAGVLWDRSRASTPGTARPVPAAAVVTAPGRPVADDGHPARRRLPRRSRCRGLGPAPGPRRRPARRAGDTLAAPSPAPARRPGRVWRRDRYPGGGGCSSPQCAPPRQGQKADRAYGPGPARRRPAPPPLLVAATDPSDSARSAPAADDLTGILESHRRERAGGSPEQVTGRPGPPEVPARGPGTGLGGRHHGAGVPHTNSGRVHGG